MFFMRAIIIAMIMNLWMENFSNTFQAQADIMLTIIERIETIIKPPNDRRLYRGLKLYNEMRILLISDPLATKSAAAMVIGAGSMNDFREVPGIANLVVALMSAGSKQHSELFYEFGKIVRARGGELKMISELSNQVFGFEVSSERFADTLDRFAEFFTDSLLSTQLPIEVIDVGVKMLQDEYIATANDDVVRIAEVEKLICKRNHPFSHLHCGNEKTLYQHTKDFPETMWNFHQKSLNNHIRKFHSIWHSSNIMTLAVFGKESLDELERIVVHLFQHVENKNAKRIIYPFKYHPWGPEQVMNYIYVVPLSEDIKFLRLSFPIPDIQAECKTLTPILFLEMLLVYQGPNTLHSLLREEDLCDNLTVDGSTIAGFGFFQITCDLTNNGVDHIENIISLIFEYIHLFKTASEDTQERIFEEFRTLQKINFDFHIPENVEKALTFVEELADDMQTFNMEDILSYKYLLPPWNPIPIEELLSYIRPDNMNVTIGSQSFEGIAVNEEVEYGAKYVIEKISAELIEKWKNVKSVNELQLPPPNEYIPKNFELYPISKNEPSMPYVLYKSSISEIWFKQDNKHTPKLYVQFELMSKAACFDPFKRSLWYLLFSNLFTPAVKESLYAGSLAGFDLGAHTSDHAAVFKLNGFNDTLPILLETVLTKIVNLENDITQESFDITLKKRINMMSDRNILKDQFYRTDLYSGYIQTHGSWSIQEDLKASKILQYSDMKKFLKNAFKRIFVRVFIHGNCTKQCAMNIANMIERPFLSSYGILPQERLPDRKVEITNGSHFIYLTFNEEKDIYGYSSYFQWNTETSTLHDVTGTLLYTIIESLCQGSLRISHAEDETQNVNCGLVDSYGTKGMLIKMHSTKDFRTMESKVEKFIRFLASVVKNMTGNEFEMLKKKLEARISAMPERLEELSRLYWYEIQSQIHNFDRTKKELKQLRSLKKLDLENFFKEMLTQASPRRRRVSVYVFPKHSVRRKPENILPGAIQFEEIIEFQNNLNLLPVNFRP